MEYGGKAHEDRFYSVSNCQKFYSQVVHIDVFFKKCFVQGNCVILIIFTNMFSTEDGSSVFLSNKLE